MSPHREAQELEQNGQKENPGSLKSRGVGTFRLILSAIFALVTVVIWGFFYSGRLRAEEIISPSMTPTIEVGDRIIVRELGEDEPINRGDVIIFESPDDDNPLPLIKRVAGVPGDYIFYVGRELYINHRPTVDELVDDQNIPSPRDHVYQLPEGTYIVLGDNSEYSHDSRNFGPIIHESIIGKAVFKYFPFSDYGWIEGKELNAYEENIPKLDEEFYPSAQAPAKSDSITISEAG